MPFSRRVFATSLVGVPLIAVPSRAMQATPAASPASHRRSVAPTPIEGMVLSVSPNGELVALQTGDGGLAIAELATGKVLSQVAASPHTNALDPQSITWRADSSGFAFAVRAFQLLVAGIILEVAVGADELVAITGDVNADMRLEFEDDWIIDTGPAFAPDGTLYFVRSENQNDLLSTTIMVVPVDAPEPVPLHTMSTTNVGSVFGPIWAHDDGTVTCQYSEDFRESSIVRAGPDHLETVLDFSDYWPEGSINLWSMGNNATMFVCTDVRRAETFIVDTESDDPPVNEIDLFVNSLVSPPALHPTLNLVAGVDRNDGYVSIYRGIDLVADAFLGEWNPEGTHRTVTFGGDSLVVSNDDTNWHLEIGAPGS